MSTETTGTEQKFDWPGHQGGRVRVTELNGGLVGGIDFDGVLAILQSLEPPDAPLFVRVDGVSHALIVDKVVEIKWDDFGDPRGLREVYLHARPQVSGTPTVSLKEQLDRMIPKTAKSS